MSSCPCGTGRPFDECCGPVIEGRRPAATAEELMRSRYTAYTRGAVDYIVHTTRPDQQKKVDRGSVQQWSESATWKGIDILRAEQGGPEDAEGMVEFVARFTEHGKDLDHHEQARFARIDGRWYFDHRRSAAPPLAAGAKVGRNDPCPCGSGRKHKKCCGAA